MLFNGYPRRTDPPSLLEFIAYFLKNFLQGAYIHRCNQEEMHCFVKSFPSLLGRSS